MLPGNIATYKGSFLEFEMLAKMYFKLYLL